jgi:hypothetical protein
MREVLYPKYLFGGSMLGNTDSIRGAYANLREAGFQGAREELVGLAGRALDADNLLAGGGMSEGLRDWDLWGPLVFCLLLSLLLSIRAQKEQASLVFSGVFAMVWLGEVLVTMQIKLLGGNMCVFNFPGSEPPFFPTDAGLLTSGKLLRTICLYNRIHPLPPRNRSIALCFWPPPHPSNPYLYNSRRLVISCWCQYPGWIWCRQESRRHCRLPTLRVLSIAGLLVLY